MRLPSLSHLGRHAVPSDEIAAHASVNPYHVWYNTFAAGALFACLAFVIEGTWDLAWLSARVRGYPCLRDLLRGAFPVVAIGESAAFWVATWLLTTEVRRPTARAPVRVGAADAGEPFVHR